MNKKNKETMKDSNTPDKKTRDTLIRCTCCKKELPIEDFGINKNFKKGIDNKCKSCRAMYMRNYYHNVVKPKKGEEKKRQCACCKKTLPLSKFYKKEIDLKIPRPLCLHCTNSIRSKDPKEKKTELQQLLEMQQRHEQAKQMFRK